MKKESFLGRSIRSVSTVPFLLPSLICFTLFSITLTAIAVPPSTPYTPGATLSPSCAPGSTNCTVGILESQDEGSNLTYSTTALNFVGSGVTATESSGVVTVTVAGGAATLAAISSGSTTTPNSLYTMTAGVPVKFESSDNLTVLYLDETNERVGIGKPAPTQVLDVNGNIELSGHIRINDQQVVYLPNQASFIDTLILGDGGGSLVPDGDPPVYNTFVGIGVAQSLIAPSMSTIIGSNAASSATSAVRTTIIGSDAAYSATSAGWNVVIGDKAAYSNTSNWENVIIGSEALYSDTTAFQNVVLGVRAGYDITTGQQDVIIGAYTMSGVTSSSSNVVIGDQAGSPSVGSSYSNSVIVGAEAGTAGGDESVAIGYLASAGGNRNVSIGTSALNLANASAVNNIAIGWGAGDTITSGSSNILLGYNTEPTAGTASNELNIGNTIFGNLSSSLVGIGTTNFNGKLTVEGVLALDEITAPSATAGYGKLYVKSSDSLLYFKDDGGTEYGLTAGGGNPTLADIATNSTSTAHQTFALNASTNLIIEDSGGTDIFTVDGTNDRVGIGQSSPTARLHVVGPATTANLFTFTGTTPSADGASAGGGTITLAGGAEGTLGSGGAGGGFVFTAGNGGQASGDSGGAGGSVTVTAGTGGLGDTTAGAGGSVTVNAGPGGVGPNGAGGSVAINTGDGGDVIASSAVGGAGGTLTLTTGDGGDGVLGGNDGGNISLIAGAGGTDTGDADDGEGGNISLSAGGGGGTTNGNGGNVTLNAGAGTGAGSDGNILLATTTGMVGIGATPTHLLHVENSGADTDIFSLKDSDGTCLHNPESGSETVSCSSDERLKDNIVDASSALEYFKDFRIREYTVKNSNDQLIGVVAQEVLETHPELVTQGSDGYYSVILPNLWQVVKGIQELDIQLAGIQSLDETDSQSFLSRLLVKFESLFVRVGELTANVLTVGSREKPTGITLYDEITGEPHCLSISNGQSVTRAGECGTNGPIINNTSQIVPQTVPAIEEETEMVEEEALEDESEPPTTDEVLTEDESTSEDTPVDEPTTIDEVDTPPSVEEEQPTVDDVPKEEEQSEEDPPAVDDVPAEEEIT